MSLGRRYFPLLTISVGIFFLFGFSYADKAPYSFAKEATSALPVEYYDYIVVGGGTAGCALAATLSLAAKVLLLERGGLPYHNPNVTKLDNFFLDLQDTSPYSPVQPFVSTDGVFDHRARVLGGGSAINAGFFTYASSQYIQEAGWDPQLVKESYEWARRKVAFRPQLQQWQAAVRSGLLEAGVLPDRGFTYEHLNGTKTGGSIFDENGYRHTAADLLEYANSTNIIVYLHATVQKLLINKTSRGQVQPKACGVLFKDLNGTNHLAYLNNGPRNEIILSAGALGSPQILLLSGLGPAQELRGHGIEVVLDQPRVGQGMSDNPLNGIVVPTPKPVGKSLVQVVGISGMENYIETLSGFAFDPWVQTIAKYYPKSVNQTSSRPSDAQIGLILEKVARPFSVGHLELETNDPSDNPRVTFNYFQDPRDIDTCVRGMEIIKKVVESRSVAPFLYPNTSFQSFVNLTLEAPTNLRPKHPESAYSLRQFCNDTVLTIWHYHGGCQVDKVVDRDYKVIGMAALRVVDGSTFYNSPGTNPQATVMMLGRYMGQKILRERLRN